MSDSGADPEAPTLTIRDMPAVADPVSDEKRGAEIEEAWSYYRTWAATSRELKGQGEDLRRWMVRGTFIAVLIGPLAQYVGVFGFTPEFAGQATAFFTWISAIFVTGVAFFNEKILGPEKDKPWLKARAVAEKIKGETYRYIMRTEPYEAPGENALSEHVHEIREKLRGVSPIEISAEEKRANLPPPVMGGDEYVEHRIVDQIDFFRARRDENQKTVDRYRYLGWMFGGISALLVLPAPAAVKIFQGVDFEHAVALGASVASGVSGFLVANLSAGRYKYLAESYEAARSDLDSLRSTWRTSTHTTEKLHTLVTRAEDILAKENAGWYEEMSRPK